MTVYLLWLMNKLEETFDTCVYDIQKFKRNTVTIDDVDYTF